MKLHLKNNNNNNNNNNKKKTGKKERNVIKTSESQEYHLVILKGLNFHKPGLLGFSFVPLSKSTNFSKL